MSLRILTMLLCSALLIAACKDDETKPNGAVSDFKLTFKSNYNGERLIKYHQYPYGANAYPLEFSRFTLFLTDVTLLNGTQETVVAPSLYLDFTPDNASSDTSAYLNYTFANIPEGTYTGIKIGYGVKPSDNAKNPADFPPSSPLYNDNEYWLGWKSYIFCKIEAQGDSDKDGVYDHFNIYHCGGSLVYKTFTFTQPITVGGNAKATNVNFDLRKLFIMDDGRYYNMVTSPSTSNNKDSLRVANDIMGKFGKATTLEQ